MASKSTTRPWKRTFFTIWGGQALSLYGSELVQFALVWWLTLRTDSATVLSVAMLVGIIPRVVLSPLAGAVIDRYNRQRIMIWADSGIALTTLALVILAALGLLEPWHIYIALTLRSVGQTFHLPAMEASTTLLVPREQLARVGGINQTLYGLVSIAAPPLGALLYELLPLSLVLAVDILSAAGAVGTLLVVHIPQPPAGAPSHANPFHALLNDSLTGIRYVYAWRGLFILLLGAALVNMMLSPVSALLPLLITRVFKGTVVQLGLLDSLFGIGMIAGGLVLSAWGGFRRRIVTSMISLILMGSGVLLIGAAPADAFWLVLAGILLVGTMQAFTNGPITAVVQASVPPEVQGRVFTTMNTLSSLMAPLGLLLAGPVADALGIRSWYYIAGATCIVFGALGLVAPDVRHIERQPAAAAPSDPPAAP